MESRDKQILDLAMEAGKTLLDAGAEIFRAEETIQRIVKAYGIEKSNAFVMSTGIFLTAENKGQEIYAQVRHIPINSARLNTVAAVNQLSREIVEGRYTVEEAWERLEAIKNMPGKKDFTRIPGIRCRLRQLCYVLGGGIRDAAAAFLAGFLLYVLLVVLEKREKKTSKIVLNLLGGFWASFLAVVFYRMGVGDNYGSILVGSIMPLVPGVSFVNSIRDFADGDYIGGGVRMLDTLLVALGIALGVGLMYMLYYKSEQEVFSYDGDTGSGAVCCCVFGDGGFFRVVFRAQGTLSPLAEL